MSPLTGQPRLEAALARELPDISAMGRMIFDPIWQSVYPHRSGRL
jgi:hypothetical protein